MLGMSPLQLSATLAAVVAGRPPFSLLAAAAPGATGLAQKLQDSKQVDPGPRQLKRRGLQATPAFDQKFWVPDRNLEANLGEAMAISPDGTYLVASDKNDNFGGAHLFKKDAITGDWTWQSRHYYSGPWHNEEGERLGERAIAVSNDWFFLGATGSRIRQMVVGYKRNANGSWPATETVTLTIPSGETTEQYGDRFGSAVGVDGDILLVGANAHTQPGCRYCGAAYVYERDGDNWVYVAKLTPDYTMGYGRFGEKVVIRGDEIIVPAAYQGCSAHDSGCGKVWIYKKSANVWPTTPTTIIEPPYQQQFYFGKGISLSTDNNLLAVGATGGGGHVYLFKRNPDGSWPSAPIQEISPGLGGTFGVHVFLQGNTMVVAARPSAYVYHANADGTFPDTAAFRLTATDGPTATYFGEVLVVDTDGQVIVADNYQPKWNQPNKDGCATPSHNNQGGGCGAIYAFDNSAFEAIGPWAITETPTATPTQAPTAAGPLTLDFDKVEANFTSGASNELEVGFFVGVGRNVAVEVRETCDKGAEEVPSSIFTENVTVSHDLTQANLTHSKVIVGYNFNKAQMINSSLWNSTSETLAFCQVTSITVPDQVGGGSFVVFQDKREIEVKFDLDANFEVDVDLGDRIIRNETEFINFDEDVEAYKCRGGSDNSFSVDDEALPPNTELAICIVQNNTSVIIDRLAYMVIAQGANLSPNLPMVFVNDGNPELGDGLTKISKESQGVILKTRLPQGPDYFQFESGLSLNISGTVDLELATGRKLRALAGENNVAGEEGEVAEINVVVGLQSTADGFGPIGSSDGHAIVGKGLAAIGLMVLAVIGIVMM